MAMDQLIARIEAKMMNIDVEEQMICPTCKSTMKGKMLDDLAKHLASKPTCLAGLPPESVERLDQALPKWGFSPAEFKKALLMNPDTKPKGELNNDAAQGSGVPSTPSAPKQWARMRLRSEERSPPRKRQLLRRDDIAGPLSGRGWWVWWPEERGTPPPRSWLQVIHGKDNSKPPPRCTLSPDDED